MGHPVFTEKVFALASGSRLMELNRMILKAK